MRIERSLVQRISGHEEKLAPVLLLRPLSEPAFSFRRKVGLPTLVLAERGDEQLLRLGEMECGTVAPSAGRRAPSARQLRLAVLAELADDGAQDLHQAAS